MKLELVEGASPDVATVRVIGDVDAATSTELRQFLLQVSSEGPLKVCVDLSGVTFVDSTGLGVLIGALKRQRIRGGTLVLTDPTDPVRKVLRITGLDETFGLG